ncbi:MAG: asparagine synthetase B, partial [Dehalococcoidia bacterium]|nr:asparagine synthetase B [Dehalococcoidia bacterium]
MSATLSHRGPDACGAWGAPAVGFGHQRLSIIDLSVDGRQPMLDESGQVALVCNGEIYNHLELRERALARGHEFRSHSDSEVLVHRYEDLVDEPARLLDELDGMFAFAIY